MAAAIAAVASDTDDERFAPTPVAIVVSRGGIKVRFLHKTSGLAISVTHFDFDPLSISHRNHRQSICLNLKRLVLKSQSNQIVFHNLCCSRVLVQRSKANVLPCTILCYSRVLVQRCSKCIALYHPVLLTCLGVTLQVVDMVTSEELRNISIAFISFISTCNPKDKVRRVLQLSDGFW